MRLVTWNACRGSFDSKAPLLKRLNADIAVIQEIAAPAAQTRHTLWFGDSPKQGMAVVAREPYRLAVMGQHAGAPKHVIPISVEGPVSFALLAVWTLGQQPVRYVRAASTAIDMYASIFANHSAVMLGDFNSNAAWDKDHPRDLNHSAMVRWLEAHGLVSAYHHFYQEQHGKETRHTFFQHWNAAKQCHIDFCFLPAMWASRS